MPDNESHADPPVQPEAGSVPAGGPVPAYGPAPAQPVYYQPQPVPVYPAGTPMAPTAPVATQPARPAPGT